MNDRIKREYGCKNEELPVLCGFVSYSFKRDLADFTAFSGKFTQNYADELDQKISNANNLVSPESESILMKGITKRMYGSLDNLNYMVHQLEQHIDFTENQLGITTTDLKLSELYRKILNRDVEAVQMLAKGVFQILEPHVTVLTEAGMPQNLLADMKAAVDSISADKQQRYEILSQRKALVENNLGELNELYAQLNEILNTGKILYKKTNPVKYKEYTFSALLKRVRAATKEAASEDAPEPETE
ncbi:MAG: hypothetical protein AB7S69_02355 [Salinivirgaceae bacterium]